MTRKLSTSSLKNTIEDSPLYLLLFFLMLLAGLVILFGEFLFSGEMLFGIDTIQSGFYHRTFLVNYFNEHASIPQWDPYQFGGMPYVDAFHGDIFYPLSFLKFFIPLYLHLGLLLVLHIFLAGVFMFLASRDLGLDKTAALFSAASYMFAPYLISLVASGHDGNIYVASLFPLVILFLNRGFKTKPFLSFSLLGLVLGMIFLSPHPRMSYFTLWAVVLFALYKLYIEFNKNRTVKSLVKPIIFMLYSIVIALSFSAIQIYPGYEYTSEHSIRAKEVSNWNWATSYSLHEEDVLAQLIPEFSGFTSTTHDIGFYWGKNASKYNLETVGIVPLLLALIGFFFSKRRDAYFFGGLALFAVVYALGATTPLFKLFYHLVPLVHALRAPAMIMFLFSFSISLLAGFGFQTITHWHLRDSCCVPKRFYYLVSIFVLFTLLLAILFSFAGRQFLELWTSVFFEVASIWKVGEGVTKFDLAILNLPSLQFGALLGFSFSVLSAILIWTYITRMKSILILSLLIVITIVDGVRFNKRFISTFDHEYFQRTNGVVDFFVDNRDYYRVFNLDAPYTTEMLCQFGIEIVNGRHGNQIRSYSELFNRSIINHSIYPRFYNLVGSRYLLHSTRSEISGDLFGPIPFRIEKTFRDMNIIRNDNAFKRAYLLTSYEVLSEQEEIFQQVLEGERDLKEVVYLEIPPDISIPTVPLGSDSAWIVSKEIDSILIGTHCTANRILALIENYYDNWHVFIDGRPAKILRAYGSFRAVAVPAGSERVLFKYKSERYEIGKTITVLTSMYFIFILGMSALKERFKKK